MPGTAITGHWDRCVGAQITISDGRFGDLLQTCTFTTASANYTFTIDLLSYGAPNKPYIQQTNNSPMIGRNLRGANTSSNNN